MNKPLKAVFDTQLFLRTLINPNSLPAKLAPTLWVGVYELYLSDEIEAEIVEVLSRPRIRMKFPQITENVVNQLVESIRQSGHRVTMVDVEAVSRDPKDDKFLACAKATQADYLVSEDQDLLVIGIHGNTKIVDAEEFLRILEGVTQQTDPRTLPDDDTEE